MSREENHKRTVEFLNSLTNEDGKPAFKLKVHNKLRDRAVLSKEIEINDTFEMVSVLLSTFSIMSGSAGDIDFYKLFQAYLLNEEKRKKINEIL